MKLQQAEKALKAAGFKTTIIDNDDSLVELYAEKNGICEIFYDCNVSGHCSTYICEFDGEDQLIKYAEKSIRLGNSN